MLIHGFGIDCVPTAIVGYGRRSDAQICIKPVCRCPRRGERNIVRDGLLPVVDGRKHFLALPATLRDLGHHLFDELGQRPARKPQCFLGALFNRTIYANIYLRHAANSTHVDLAPFNC